MRTPAALQFHLPFYASRALPNTFALVLSNWAVAAWLRGGTPRKVIALLSFTVVVIRGDAALLAAPVRITYPPVGALMTPLRLPGRG